MTDWGKRLLAALLAGTAVPALAQTAATDAPASAADAANSAATADAAEAADASAASGDIVVTARRVEERLQDVPVAVSAVTDELIRLTGARNLTDIARLTPGFSFDSATGNLSQPTIRGQAQSRLSNPVQNVATFFNGLYLQRPYQVETDLLDLERIEVIKGPQSALFGRNAFSGALSIVTRKPDLDEVRVRAEGTIGTDERYEVKGAVSIPIAQDVAAISFAGSVMRFDGTWENNHPLADADDAVTKGNLGGWRNESFLVQARLQPVEALTMDLFYSHRDILTEVPPVYSAAAIGLISGFNTLNCSPFESFAQPIRGTNALLCGAAPVRPVLAPGESRPAGYVVDPRSYGNDGTSRIFGASVAAEFNEALTLNYQFGWVRGESEVLGSLSRDPLNGTAAAGSPGPLAIYRGRTLFDSRPNGDIDTTSHEAKLYFDQGPLRAMIGGYYAEVDDFEWGVSYAAVPNVLRDFNRCLFPAQGLTCEQFAPPNATDRTDQVRAIFGSVGVDIGERLRVTVEARQTWEEKEEQAVTFPARAPVNARLNETFKYFTPRLTVDFKPTDDSLLYASAAKGVKSGGFNANAIDPALRTYEPESNWTYEIGAKTSWLDSRLQANVAAFYVDWSTLQINRAQPNAAIGTPLIFGNISGASSKGVELETLFRPVDVLTLTFGAAYNDTTFDDDALDPTIPRALCQAVRPAGAPACPYTADIGGNKLPRAPSLQISGSAQLRDEFANGLGWFARVDGYHQNKMYIDNTNVGYVPQRTLADASVGLEGEWWTLRAWVKNLFDKEYVSYPLATFAGSGAGSGVTYTLIAGERRTAGLTLGLRWN